MMRNINQLVSKLSETTNITSVKTIELSLIKLVNLTETFNNYFYADIGKSFPVIFHISLSSNNVTTALNKLKVSKSS